MPETVGYDEWTRMLRAAARQVKDHHETLSKLDSHGGDGDHGTTMLRAMGCLEKAIDAAASRDIQQLLNDVGWAIMGVDGGATGPLLGTLFMSMAETASGKETLGARDLAAMFEAGLAGIQEQTKAKAGDKTMIDALVPAVQAIRKAAEEDRDVVAVLERAAEAAEQGAAATKDLQARFGRARNIGAKSIGVQDPGATSMSLVFRGFAEGIRET